jgi:hypothetical protein
VAVGFASMCVQRVAYRWSIELDSWLQASASPHKLWRAEPSLTPPPLLPGECETATQSPWMHQGLLSFYGVIKQPRAFVRKHYRDSLLASG